jgi:hypothetical protein
MGEYSKNEWRDHTFNPWIGCQKVSPPSEVIAGNVCGHCAAQADITHQPLGLSIAPRALRLLVVSATKSPHVGRMALPRAYFYTCK